MKLLWMLVLAATNAVFCLHIQTEKAQIEGRIVDGHTATRGQFPYAVLIESKLFSYSKICGGALIGVNWVLSVASCFYGMLYAVLYLGITDIQDADISYEVKSDEFIIHPGWASGSFQNDIALVRIPRTAFCLNIFPVPLPATGAAPGNMPTFEGVFATAIGWGATNIDLVMSTLQYTRLSVTSNEVCNLFLNDITGDQLCATKTTETIFTENDVGAPLVTDDGLLIGLMTKYKHQSETTDFIIVFTRITTYLNWILAETNKRSN